MFLLLFYLVVLLFLSFSARRPRSLGGGYCKNLAWLAFRCLDWEIGLVHLHGYIP